MLHLAPRFSMPDLEKDRLLSRSPGALSALAGVFAALVGVAVLIGWQSRIDFLKAPFSSGNSTFMAPNAALCFILLGLALWLRRVRTVSRPALVVAGSCAAFVLLFGALTLVEYVTGSDFGSDRLFFHHRIREWMLTSPPGRFAENTALAFVLLGSALLLLERKWRRQPIAELLAAVAVLIAFLGTIGYWYDVPYLAGVGHVAKMGLPTAITFTVLALGVFFARGDAGLAARVLSRDVDGVVARRLLLTVFLVLPFFGWVVLQLENKGIVEHQFGMAMLVSVCLVVFCLFIVGTVGILHRAVVRRRLADAESEAARAAAENDKRRLQAVMEALPVGMAITDSRGGNIQSNAAFEQVWGGPHPATESVADYAAYRAWWIDTGIPVAPGEWASAVALEKGESVVGQLLKIHRFDGAYADVINSAAPVRDAEGNIVGTAVAIQDITRLQEADEQVSRQNAVLKGINTIFEQALKAQTKEELGRTCLSVAEQITGSKFGFIGEIGDDGILRATALSDPGWEACAMWDKVEKRRSPSGFKIHGIYGRVLQDGRSLLTNSPATHPDSIGAPPGHPTLTAFLGVPLIEAGRTAGIIGVGNREGGYTQTELQSLEALAPAVMEALRRVRTEQALRESEVRLQLALDSAHIGIHVWDIISGELHWDDRLRSLWGLPPGAPVNYDVFLAGVHPDDRGSVQQAVQGALDPAGDGRFFKEYRVVGRNDGVERWIAATGQVFFQDGKAVRLVGTAVDGTAAKQRERQLERLNRTLKALNDSNEALLHAADEGTLLGQVCKIITEDCGHPMVWIGFAEDDEQKAVRPAAHAGFEEGYLDTLHITWADSARGRGPTGTAIRTGQPCRCRDMRTDPQFSPWRSEALRHGYASSVALPLMADDKAFGAMTIYAREPDAFSDEEVKLLDELAADLAYGLQLLRLRSAHDRTVEALRQNEQQLRVAALAAEIGAWSWVPGTAYVVVSANWRRLFGVAADEPVTFETWRNALHPEDRERAVAELNAASEQHRDFNTEYRVLWSNGIVRWIVDRGRATYDEDGKAIGMAGINLDITKRKRAEEALQQASEQRRLALEAAGLGAWDYRFATGEVFWDERARTMFGLSGDTTYEEAMGRIHSDDRPQVELALQRALAGEGDGVYDAEFRVTWPDKSVHWISSHGRVHFEGEGEQRHPVRFIGVNTDISERTRAEQALIQSEKLASVGRMAATIAHEINNPLAAVINALYLVGIDKSLSTNARQNLRLAEEELDRVVQITKTTLGFYRETSGPTAVSLPGLMESVLALYRRKLREKGIKVTTQYDPGNGEVSGSAGEIRQVLANLLANSLDAVAPGGAIHISIGAVTSARGRTVRLTIADNGAGIRPDHLKRIFDPFFTTKESFGTGLGLWVSREIVSKCGGTIRVRSRVGQGTVFSITFPRPAARSVVAGVGQ